MGLSIDTACAKTVSILNPIFKGSFYPSAVM